MKVRGRSYGWLALSIRLVGTGIAKEKTSVALQTSPSRTVPTLDIDAYAQTVYQANRPAGL